MLMLMLLLVPICVRSCKERRRRRGVEVLLALPFARAPIAHHQRSTVHHLCMDAYLMLENASFIEHGLLCAHGVAGVVQRRVQHLERSDREDDVNGM